MPEYLAPGVYVEETSFRSKSIEGVSTTTTGLIGPARYGPVTQTPDILTSLGEFERIYGGGEPLEFKKDGRLDNYLWHGVRAFYSEGGKRLYVARVFRPLAGEYSAANDSDPQKQGDSYIDGHARVLLNGITLRARFPGKAGNMNVRFALRLGPNLLKGTKEAPTTDGANEHDLVYLLKPGSSSDPDVVKLATEIEKVGAASIVIATQVNKFVVQVAKEATDAATAAKTATSAAAAAVLVETAKQKAGEAIAADTAEFTLREIVSVAQAAVNAVTAAEAERSAKKTAFDAAPDAPSKAKAELELTRAVAALFQAISTALAATNNLVAQAEVAVKYVRTDDSAAVTTELGKANIALATAGTHAGKAVLVGDFCLVNVSAGSKSLQSTTTPSIALDPTTDKVFSVNVSLGIIPEGRAEVTQVWDNIGLDPRRLRNGLLDTLFAYFTLEPANQDLARTLPLVALKGDTISDGLKALAAIFNLGSLKAKISDAFLNQKLPEYTQTISLTGGNDGQRPGLTEYEGKDNPDQSFKTGLKQFEDLEDISIVAAPGSTYRYQTDFHDDAISIMNQLINHARTMRYRIAVLDSGDALSISAVRELRARFDSTYGAFYYPWVRILDPITRQEINLPPSGFVAGIYARNDINRAVWKAPANEVVNLALGFEKLINKAQQDVLNPEGINCFRFFEGRGMLLWGARTISSDPEWKYVNLRRYFAYLERSIDKGTQWAVFEPNGEALWANVRRTIEDFLLNEWQMGALLGDKPEKAYFVKCDRSTMTQNDLDNGRLICLIGVAPLRPAEFVIFRIGQWTGDRRV